MKGEIILYLGMADDIMGPLLMFPNVKTIFVICKFDKAFSSKKTWKSQKGDIKKVLKRGKKKCNGGYSKELNEETDVVHYLDGKSKILEEEDDENSQRWYLKFLYNGQERELIYFHHRDFSSDWPNEIQKVEAVICTGALSIADIYYKHIPLVKLFLKRCKFSFPFIGEEWNFVKHCGHRITKKFEIYDARNVAPSKLAYFTITKTLLKNIINERPCR